MIGKVIKIPNDQTIVISKMIPEIALGTKVGIYEEAAPIIDPETKDELGSFDFIKQKLEVVEVYEKYFICKEFIKKTYTPFALEPTSFFKKTITESVKLNVDDSQNENLSIKDKTIRIGDPVKIMHSS